MFDTASWLVDHQSTRGRGLAVFLTFIFGATTAGSAVSLNLATPSLLLATTFLLGANPMPVSLVQVAVSPPLFLFTLGSLG